MRMCVTLRLIEAKSQCAGMNGEDKSKQSLFVITVLVPFIGRYEGLWRFLDGEDLIGIVGDTAHIVSTSDTDVAIFSPGCCPGILQPPIVLPGSSITPVPNQGDSVIELVGRAGGRIQIDHTRFVGHEGRRFGVDGNVDRSLLQGFHQTVFVALGHLFVLQRSEPIRSQGRSRAHSAGAHAIGEWIRVPGGQATGNRVEILNRLD